MLNEAQMQAVRSSGSLCMIAGAGTGKTATLTGVVLDRRARGLDTRRAFISTFTNQAANELRRRITTVSRDEQLPLPYLGTLHANAMRLIRQYDLVLNRRQDFKVIDEAHVFDIYMRHLLPFVKREYQSLLADPSNASGCNKAMKTVIKIISYLKGMLIPFNQLQEIDTIPYVANLDDRASDDLVGLTRLLYPLYEDYLSRGNQCDYDDIILMPTLIMKRSEDARRMVSSRFDLTVIDEHQDSSIAQREMIYQIASSGDLVTVGDDGQSIYGWRGADVGGIREEAARLPVVKLTENYRSTPGILALADLLIRQDAHSIQKTLTASGPNARLTSRPEYHAFDSEYDEDRYIARAIRDKIADGVSVQDIAVLCRSRRKAQSISNALAALKIKAHVEGVNFFDRLEVRFMLSWLHMISSPSDSTSMMTYFKDMAQNAILRTGIGDKASEAFYNGCRSGGLDKGLQVLSGVSSKAGDFVRLVYKMREAFFNNTDIPLVMNAIGRMTGLEDALNTQVGVGDLTAENRIKSLGELSEMAEGISFNALNDISCLSRDETQKQDAVRCLTVHSAKGMEYDHVFVTQFCNESFKMGSDDTGECWRLAYVAVTRARKFLSLSYSRIQYGKAMTMPSVLRDSRSLFSIFPKGSAEDMALRGMYPTW